MPSTFLKQQKLKAPYKRNQKPQNHEQEHEDTTSDEWWKKLNISIKDVNALPKNHICVFCHSSEDCEEKYGELLHHSFSGLSVHYFCLLFASGLSQSSESDIDDSIEIDSMYGFSIKDIIQEVRRASKLRCVYCHKMGASIGCVLTTCKSMIHFTCGLDNGYLFQFYENFKSFCSRHRPRQSLMVPNTTHSISDTKNKVIRRKKTKRELSTQANVMTSQCPICLDPIHCSVNDFQSLKTPCCCDVWLHRSCVQQQALSSGLYFFRCPVCNDSQGFSEEMQKMGIYVPERDASWELVHDAYHDLLQRHSQCDRPTCSCPHGRDYNLSGGRWAVVLCDLCGSNGTHVACDQSVENETSYHACDTCVEIHTVDGARELASQIGVITQPRPQPRRSKRISLLTDCNESHSPKKPCVRQGGGNSRVQV